MSLGRSSWKAVVSNRLRQSISCLLLRLLRHMPWIRSSTKLCNSLLLGRKSHCNLETRCERRPCTAASGCGTSSGRLNHTAARQPGRARYCGRRCAKALCHGKVSVPSGSDAANRATAGACDWRVKPPQETFVGCYSHANPSLFGILQCSMHTSGLWK